MKIAELMKAMFWGAESFNQNLSAWGDKLGKVQNMKKIFQSTALNIDFISSWKIPEDCDISELWLSPLYPLWWRLFQLCL